MPWDKELEKDHEAGLHQADTPRHILAQAHTYEDCSLCQRRLRKNLKTVIAS